MPPTLATQRLAIYTRCATAHDAGTAIERQVQRARTAIARAGGEPSAARVFEDPASSGLDIDRPGLSALLGAVDAGDLDAVIVADATRLSRDEQARARIAERMATAGVVLVRLDDLAERDGAS